MKKILLFLIAIISAVSFVGFIPKSSANAATITNYNEFSTEVNKIISDYVKFNNRTAGSEDEKKAADYIKSYLETNTTFKPLDNAFVVDGIQTFAFESTLSGKYETSQNVIFTKNAAQTTDKKIILTCEYDAIAFEYNEKTGENKIVSTEGINISAGSVALMLTLASKIDTLNLGYNVEICFFGAGESNSAGAKVYTNGIKEEMKANILGVINFDNIAVGKNIYYYVDEISTPITKYLNKKSSDSKLEIKEIDLVHLNKSTEFADENELGLSYSHIARESCNVQFMKEGITTINFFAGEYETGILLGLNEFDGKEVVTYTKNDSAQKIEELYGFNAVIENLYKVYNSISTVLVDADFQKALSDSANSTKLFYGVFGNRKLAIYLTVVSFVAFIVIAMAIYHKLNIKSYYSNVETEFLTAVIKISEQVDQTGQDENVSKVVSQVIAQDIKKDKTIKTKKKK